MPESLQAVLTMPFLRIALASAALIGTLCSYLGVHVVLRRIVFVGAALAELSALGVAVAVLQDWDPFYCSLGATVLGVLLFSLEMGGGRVPEDGYIGVSYVTAWAASILLIYIAPHGESHMRTLLQGDILGIQPQDLAHLAIAFGVLGLFHVLFFKEFLIVSFDPEMAQTLGLRARLWNFLFYLTLGVAISLAMKDAGILLVFSYLVLPPITGLLLSTRKWGVIAISVFASLLASFAGVWWSVANDAVSTGPAIVMCSFALFAVAWVVHRVTNR